MDKRITISFYIVLSVFCIFLLRLWHLQVINGGEYKKIDERNRLRVIDIPAPRGVIYDRNNNPLVKNVISFDVSMVNENMPKDDAVISDLGKLISLSPEQIKKIAQASVNPYETIKLKQNVRLPPHHQPS